jgi:hypothetical protein
MTPIHWAFADARFDMPTHWREWLGTIRTEEVEQSNLFLLSKMLSQVPEVVDAETTELKRHAGHMPGFCSQAHLRRHTSRSCLQELFIGPRHHTLMGEAYDVRSDVGHLYENKHLEVFDRASRLELTKKLEMMEYIARNALVSILLDSKLWPHFANTDALKAFWALSENELRTLWGVAINPTDALAGSDPRNISDAQLGAA